MKKIIILMLLVIFISGCALNSSSNKKTSGTPDGLHITFLQPEENSDIDENTDFFVVLDLYNGADFKIEGDICLSDLFGGTRSAVQDDCKSFSIDEKSKNLDNEPFGPYKYTNIVSEPNTLSTTLIAKAKYPCSFFITPKICVKQINFGGTDESQCKTKETLTISTAGFKSAPITVYKIEKQLGLYGTDGVKVNLNIYLKKMSKGKLDGPLNINLNYGEGETKCRDLDKLKWDEKDTEKVINCEILIENMKQPLIDDTLLINLDYLYSQEETLTFNIIDNEGEYT